MKTLWFITNPKSGTATPAKADALAALFAERGLVLAGRTAFPDDPLPTPQSLDAAEVDTAVLFAGDGTINAAVSALADWNGAILILPGGTMNMLAKLLHNSTDPAAIVADSKTEALAARALVLKTAAAKDAGKDVVLESAAAKYYASEMVGRVADRAVQIFGGAGYIADYGIERLYRDVRLFRIYEGTSQIQQLIIARETIKRGG